MTITIILALISGIVCGLFGLAVGWLLRSGEAKPTVKIVEKIVEKIIEKAPDDILQQRDEMTQLLAQLQTLTTGVTEQIGEHSKAVGSINEELSAAGSEGGGKTVVTAIRKLIESNNAMQTQLADTQVKLVEQTKTMERHAEEARTDQLTKLRNRRALDDDLNRRVAEFQKKGTPLSIMMIDVDHFKKFNDTHGHLAGDEVLRGVARVLSEKTHGKTGISPARYGGEEFSVVFAGYTAEAASHLADRIRGAIGETPVTFEGKTMHVAASGGLSQFVAGDTIASFIARADEALYASKKAGRNCAHVHDQGEIRKIAKSSAPTVETPAAVDDTGDISKSLNRRIAEWKRGGVPVSVIVTRLDNVTAIETQLGAAGCRKALETVGEFLNASLREMDQVAICAAETFGMQLPTAKLIDAARIAERMRMKVEAGELDAKAGIHLSLSFGVAEVTPDDDADNLLGRARRALELARRKGGNAVYLHDGHRSDAVRERLELVDEQHADLQLANR